MCGMADSDRDGAKSAVATANGKAKEHKATCLGIDNKIVKSEAADGDIFPHRESMVVSVAEVRRFRIDKSNNPLDEEFVAAA